MTIGIVSDIIRPEGHAPVPGMPPVQLGDFWRGLEWALVGGGESTPGGSQWPAIMGGRAPFAATLVDAPSPVHQFVAAGQGWIASRTGVDNYWHLPTAARPTRGFILTARVRPLSAWQNGSAIVSLRGQRDPGVNFGVANPTLQPILRCDSASAVRYRIYDSDIDLVSPVGAWAEWTGVWVPGVVVDLFVNGRRPSGTVTDLGHADAADIIWSAAPWELGTRRATTGEIPMDIQHVALWQGDSVSADRALAINRYCWHHGALPITWADELGIGV